MKLVSAVVASGAILVTLIPAGSSASMGAEETPTGPSKVVIDATSLTSVPDTALPFIEVVGDGHLPTLSPAEDRALADTVMHGDAKGDELDEIRRSAAFNALTDSIATSHPKTFTTSARAMAGDYDYDVVFTERPPTEVFEIYSKSASTVRLRYGAPLNADQLLLAQKTILGELAARKYPVESAQIVSSPLSSALGIVLPTAPGSTSSEAALETDLESVVATTVGASGLSVFVNFSEGDAPPNREFVTAHGGYGITGCTSGFGARRNSNGVKGIVTAKHCTDEPYYGSTGMQFNPALDAGPQRDSQFNGAPSPHTSDFNFYSAAGTLTAVVWVGNPAFGDPANTYGKTTGRQNGYVNNVNTCYLSWCYVFATTAVANDGDSGGPCFYANTARGIVSGGNGSSVTYCTRISEIGPFSILTTST